MALPLLGQVTPRHAIQVGADYRQQPIERRMIAVPPVFQQSRDLACLSPHAVTCFTQSPKDSAENTGDGWCLAAGNVASTFSALRCGAYANKAWWVLRNLNVSPGAGRSRCAGTAKQHRCDSEDVGRCGDCRTRSSARRSQRVAETCVLGLLLPDSRT